MKVLHLLVGICFVHQIRGQLENLQTDCITTEQLLRATVSACQQKNNTALWQGIIDCHFQITEQYLRNSSEAKCPENKFVEDPTDTSHSIQEVFFNICGITEGPPLDIAKGFNCLINGNDDPYRMDHKTEVKDVKSKFGDKVPCDIGECIKKLFHYN